MSHFSVLVVGDNPEEQLLPYADNSSRVYLEFKDMEDEYLKKYEESSKEYCEVDMPNIKVLDFDKLISGKQITYEANLPFKSLKVGDKVCVYTNKISLKEVIENTDHPTVIEPVSCFAEIVSLSTNKFHYKSGYSGTATIIKCNEPRDIPNKERYKTFEEYCKLYFGNSCRDEEKNRYGYWINPNTKYDWYELGGRYADTFKIKKKIIELTKMEQKSGLTYAELVKLSRWLIKSPKLYKEIIAKYKGKETLIDEAVRNRVWETKFDFHEHNTYELGGKVKNGYGAQAKKKYIDFVGMADELKLLYRNLYQKSKVRDAVGELLNTYFDGISNEELLTLTEDEFVNKQNNKFITFAILKDGKWYENGKMSWFANVEATDENWPNTFKKIFDSIDEDSLLSIYDCHI